MSLSPLFLTVAAANYLSFVQVFARSLRKEIPSARLSVLVTDATPQLLAHIRKEFDPDIELLCCNDLRRETLEPMRRYYSILEFNSACKILALYHYLVSRSEDECFFIDPDMYVLGDFIEATRAVNCDMVVVPHTSKPYPEDGQLPSEKELVISGQINGGFLYARNTPGTIEVLEWLLQQIRYNWFVAPTYGMYADQQWLSFLPQFFGKTVGVLKSPAINIAYWNLHERPLRREKSIFYVGEDSERQPAALFHFSGFRTPSRGCLTYHSQRKFDSQTEQALVELIAEYETMLGLEQARLKESGITGDLSFSCQPLKKRMSKASAYWNYRYVELMPPAKPFERLRKYLSNF